jgi:hypothetical protein
MTNKKISFDLNLSNKIYKENLKSLIKSSIFNLNEIKRQNDEFIKKLHDNESDKDWFDTSSHLANIDWILLNSIFISSFAFFEHHLFTLARIVEDKTSARITINDLSGKGIVKYCNYLFLVGNLKSANQSSKKWQEINQFQKVRNLIIHNGGMMISDSSKKLENHECFNFLNTHKVIMAGTTGLIRIRQINFIEDFKRITTEVSDDLTSEILELFKTNN